MITIDRDSWIAGFRDGENSTRQPLSVRPACDYSYWSGFVEGEAKRQGYSYSLGTLKPEDIWPSVATPETLE